MRHGQSFPESFFDAFDPGITGTPPEGFLGALPKLFDYDQDDLFSNVVDAHDNCSRLDLMIRLSNSLHSIGGAADNERTSTIPAGYIYLAQFAVHDMVSSEVIENVTDFKLASTRNLETVGFDLSSLYGRHPRGTLQFFEYEGAGRERGRFRIGWLNRNSLPQDYVPGPREDIPRMPFSPISGCPVSAMRFDPLLADIRNADNFILSQLTLLFMKLHNKFYETYKDEIEPFQVARDLTTSTFLRIIENELLPALCDPDVLVYYRSITQLEDLPGVTSSDGYRIPLECVFAGLRFGHATVRMKYRFNDFHGKFTNTRAKLKKLLDLFGLNSNAAGHLPTNKTWIIDWSRFFPSPGNLANRINFANKIEPAVNRELREHESVKLDLPDRFGKAGVGLAFRSLAKGLVFQLPTGQALHRALAQATHGSRTEVPADEISRMLMRAAAYDATDGPDKTLEQRDADFLGMQTPLFVYVLAEAAFQKQGNSLGFVGSHLVCHAFRGAILTQKNNNPSINVPEHVTTQSLATMADVIRYVS